MANGVVKWFSEEKGYGFITPSDGGKDVFVHHSGIVRDGKRRVSLEDGQEVEFITQKGQKGLQAVDVRPTSRIRAG